MHLAVVGSKGMFGQELLAYATLVGHTAEGFDRNTLNLDLPAESLAAHLQGYDAVVNAVAYTNVDSAEAETPEANTVNGIYAGRLAHAAKLSNARFIQISTDYVFDGHAARAYKVSDSANPQTSYGKSKAFGEKLVAESGADYSILRTAWLYGAYGRCFPKVIATLLRENGLVRVVDDQVGQPTWTRDLAETVFQVLQLKEMPRFVHATASGKATWAEFAREVARSIGIGEEAVEEISREDYPTLARRPAWSVLDNSSDFITPIGDWCERWQIAAPDVLREI